MDCYGKLHDPNDPQCKKCALQLDCALNTQCNVKFIDTAVQLPIIYRRTITQKMAVKLAAYGTLNPILNEALNSMQGIFTRAELETRIIICLAERGIQDTNAPSMSRNLIYLAHKRNAIRRVGVGKYELC